MIQDSNILGWIIVNKVYVELDRALDLLPEN
jgi:hypothetical protein